MTVNFPTNDLTALTHKQLVELFTAISGTTKWFPNKAAVIAAITAIRQAQVILDIDPVEADADEDTVTIVQKDARVTISGELAGRNFRPNSAGRKTFTRNVLQVGDETAQYVELLGRFWLVELQADGRWTVLEQITR